jgi:hypothetical protein
MSAIAVVRVSSQSLAPRALVASDVRKAVALTGGNAADRFS